MNDRNESASERSVYLRNGHHHTPDYGSLRRCDNPGCDVSYTASSTCRHCRRETVRMRRAS